SGWDGPQSVGPLSVIIDRGIPGHCDAHRSPRNAPVTHPPHSGAMAIAALKPLELRLRRLLLSAHGPFTGQLITSPADAPGPGDAPRILFIRAERIGDVLVSVPVLRAVSRRYPRARIDLLASTANYGVRSAVARWVDRVWRYEKRVTTTIGLVRQLRAAAYDLVVDLSHDPSV